MPSLTRLTRFAHRARSSALAASVLLATLGAAAAPGCDDSPDSTPKGGVEPDGSAGTGGQGDASPDGEGGADAGAGFGELVRNGSMQATQKPRPDYGALITTNDGERSYVVESRRDVEKGPFGLPWRSRFRLAAYDRDALAWTYDAAPDDVVGDVVVHPSGDVTLSVLRHAPSELAYDFVRLSRIGQHVATFTLQRPSTIPEEDLAPNDPRPLFRMKSDLADATVGAWLRLHAAGEGVIATFLSLAETPSTEPQRRLALGLAAFDWQGGTYAERWARVVEGPHTATPSAWAYDELRQREQPVRPFLTRDSVSGDLLVGRTWNETRCLANVRVFAEFPEAECATGAVDPLENERLPLAVTRFDATGVRRGTVILRPDEDAAEQVPFALLSMGGTMAVAGTVVRKLPDGTKRTYPDPNGFVDYDGYIAFYDEQGRAVRHHDFDSGRGDLLAAMRFTDDGVVAAGSAGFDRWQGGKSISRGTDPWLVWLSRDGSASAARALPLSNGSRHYHLHDVVVLERAIVAHGFSDAPMTHSADFDNHAARTFGPLTVRLSLP